MKYRTLGNTKEKISAIGLGCMGMTHAYGQPDEERGIRTIHRTLDLGINFLDTADVYGPETNEQLVGRAINDRREKVFLATKFGFSHDDGSLAAINGRPEYVHQACEASLKRLEVETIDLYYLHRVDPDVPIEETVGAMSELVDEGKIRYIGLSEVAPKTIRRAHGVHPIAAVQSEYSLWTRDIEKQVLPTLKELEISLVPFSPLGRGFLSGRITSPEDLDEDDWRRTNPRFQGENFRKNLQLVEQVKEIAGRENATAAQIALAWVLQQGQNVIPIPGTTNPAHLEENIESIHIQLSDEQLRSLNEIFPQGAASGERYPEEMMKQVDG